MRVIIHVGMHKTGSSSLQSYLAEHCDPRFCYAPWTDPNHSSLFVLLFQKPELVGQHHWYQAQGEQFKAQLPRLREEWTAKTEAAIEKAAAREQDFVFSAEGISDTRYQHAREEMRRFFLRYTSNIQLIGYVRSPLSFARSAFQEMLKSGSMLHLDMKRCWPYYRTRLEPIDELFGKDNVSLRKFSREALHESDIVADFCKAMDMDPPAARPPADNESLSLEATSLLFVHRRFGSEVNHITTSRTSASTVFRNILKQIGSRRFTFGETLWGPVRDAHGEDLRWAENRLGTSLDDNDELSNASLVKIQGEEDFVNVALELQREVDKGLKKRLKAGPSDPIKQLTRTLDLLHLSCWSE